MNSWDQETIQLGRKSRGVHLVTEELLERIPSIHQYKMGLAHFFLQHTSASLTINENADPSVRVDMNHYFNELVKENTPYFTHTYEGSDDMPAHIKSSLLGNELTIPILNGSLNIGVWQGIYLCEHRNDASSRSVVVTINGVYK